MFSNTYFLLADNCGSRGVLNLAESIRRMMVMASFKKALIRDSKRVGTRSELQRGSEEDKSAKYNH